MLLELSYAGFLANKNPSFENLLEGFIVRSPLSEMYFSFPFPNL